MFEHSVYRWKKLYDGMQISDVKEFKSLRDENSRPEEVVGRAGFGGRDGAGDSGKKVVKARTRRAMAWYAVIRGLSERKAV